MTVKRTLKKDDSKTENATCSRRKSEKSGTMLAHVKLVTNAFATACCAFLLHSTMRVSRKNMWAATAPCILRTFRLFGTQCAGTLAGT